jgi:nucleotide-binding universal stress UspA family protein
VKMQSTNRTRHILCATDLTERSADAWDRAVSLARQSGARLTLLHVVEPHQPERIARMQASRAYIELLSHAEQAAGPNGILVDVVVRRGKLRETIASTADEWNADLIVVGAPRSRRLDSIVGTTAERLVRTAKRAVLVVRREVRGAYRQVALAADLSDASSAMLRTAVHLAALDGASASVIHAHHLPYDGMMRSAGADASAIRSYRRSAQEEARRRLRSISTEAGLRNALTRVIVRHEPPAAAIGSVLELERPELLAIGASRWFLLKRLLIGSVADRLLRAATCDVLVVPHLPDVLELANVAVPARSVPLQARLHP